LGGTVRISSFQPSNGGAGKQQLIGVARVTLRFRERLVTEDCHDLVRRASGLSEPSSSSLSQAVWLAIERKTGGCDRLAHPLAEAIHREGSPILSVDDRHMAGLAGGEDRKHIVVVFRACWIAAGWSDPARRIASTTNKVAS
jgi:hypothetical protein